MSHRKNNTCWGNAKQGVAEKAGFGEDENGDVITSLSREVGRACDVFLESRGLSMKGARYSHNNNAFWKKRQKLASCFYGVKRPSSV